MKRQPDMTTRTFTDAQLARMTLNNINSALRCYRPDLRATREDARAFADGWNRVKVSTVASVIDVEGTPCVIAVDRPA